MSSIRQPRWGNASTLFLLAALLMLSGIASAISQSTRGMGQVAIVPIFSTVAGMDTLVKIDNGPRSAAVRLQFRDAAGNRAGSFNVYIGPHESWSAAITAGGQGPMLNIGDTSCVLAEDAEGMLHKVSSGQPISAEYGYIEVLEMGLPTDSVVLQAMETRSCDDLVAEFENGLWSLDAEQGMQAPRGALRVSATLIDVEQGTQYSARPVHLEHFRDIPFHVRPGSEYTLADAHDAGTASGATRSLVCIQGCELEEWESPLDAVASVLIAHVLEADFVINEEIGASSVAVLTNPLLRLYPEDHPFADDTIKIFLTDSETGNLWISWPGEVVGVPAPPPPDDFTFIKPINGGLLIPKTMQLLAVELSPEPATTVPVPIFGIDGAAPLDSDRLPTGFEADDLNGGAIVVGIETRLQPSLTSNDGTEYSGQPAILTMFTEFVNGTLVDGDGQAIRANYGHSQQGTKSLRTEISGD